MKIVKSSFFYRGKGDRQLTTPSADLATPLGYSDKHVKDPTNTDTSPAAALIVKVIKLGIYHCLQ